MSSYNEKIKRDLLGLYEGFYYMGQDEKISVLLNADVLKKIKYKPEDVKKALDLDDADPGKKKADISTEISSIQTCDQALKFFAENFNMIFQSNISELEKNVILKKVTLEELKYLYSIIFGIDLTYKCKKIDILYMIKDYCENEKRTDDLIKNLY